jgi:hypothetical protein
LKAFHGGQRIKKYPTFIAQKNLTFFPARKLVIFWSKTWIWIRIQRIQTETLQLQFNLGEKWRNFPRFYKITEWAYHEAPRGDKVRKQPTVFSSKVHATSLVNLLQPYPKTMQHSDS